VKDRASKSVSFSIICGNDFIILSYHKKGAKLILWQQ
jgi:hypothetical protein